MFAPHTLWVANSSYEKGTAMSRLTDLLRAAKQLDPQLGADLEKELKPLQKRLPFGLNFERISARCSVVKVGPGSCLT